MDVRIKLSPETYEFLLHQIPDGLQSRRALEQAQLIRSRLNSQLLGYEFDCDNDVAISLLRFAQRYCRDAVSEIDFALRATRQENPPSRRRGFFWG
jgi:hypothetical protein